MNPEQILELIEKARKIPPKSESEKASQFCTFIRENDDYLLNLLQAHKKLDEAKNLIRENDDETYDELGEIQKRFENEIGIRITHCSPFDKELHTPILDNISVRLLVICMLDPLSITTSKCPFCGRIASFSCNQVSYLCTSCDANGDAISFLMSHKLMKYEDALAFLEKNYETLKRPTRKVNES